MLKVKKIMESVLPLLYQVSEEKKMALKQICNDGAMYLESSSSTSLYCLRCGTPGQASEQGQIRCSKCGNTYLRQRNYNGKTICIRSCEIIDGFEVIKEAAVCCEETAQGLSVYSYDTSCVVIQGTEVGFFENRPIGYAYDKKGPRQWARIKKPNAYHAYLKEDYIVCVLDDSLYDNPLFQLVGDDLYKNTMADIYYKMTKRANEVDGEAMVCPAFNTAMVEYDEENVLKMPAVEVREENVENANIYRAHYWCTKCGKYSQKLDARNYGYSSNRCPSCGTYVSSPANRHECLNYFVFPQEQEDGSLLIRVDEVLFKAQFTERNVVGVDPTFTSEREISRTFYIYVLLTGKAVFFNENGEAIDKTGIQAISGRRTYHTQHYIISDQNKALMMENKAMKRTGFVEYSEKDHDIDLRYFDALVKIPALEMFSKFGMTQLVTDIIYADDKDIPGYMKKENGKNGIKNLNKLQMQSLLHSGCRLNQFVSYMQVTKKDPEAIFDDFNWVARQSHARHVIDILRVKIPNMTVKKIREYLERVDEAQCCGVSESAQLWSDYLRMLRDLDCDLTDKSLIYPNSLKREHDKASRKLLQVKNEKLNLVFRERAEENDKFAWENGEFKVLIPHDISELYEEGRKLSHCVGTYGRLVAEGQSVIAFIRKISDLDTPLCTIEIRKNTIVQARGMCNRPAVNIPNMKGFINAWAKNKGLTYAA